VQSRPLPGKQNPTIPFLRSIVPGSDSSLQDKIGEPPLEVRVGALGDPGRDLGTRGNVGSVLLESRVAVEVDLWISEAVVVPERKERSVTERELLAEQERATASLDLLLKGAA
jgi:hypothetical protein